MATAVKKRGAAAKQKKQKNFQYKGVNKQGQKVSGSMPAESADAVKMQLRKQGITPKTVNAELFSFGSGKKPIKPVDIAVFLRQLATMMKAGVPLVQSFDIIGKGHENASVQDLVQEIKEDVESGSPFASALRNHPKYFDELVCDLIHAGEQSGTLEQMLDRIATYKEKTEALKSKIKKAMMYPAAVIVVSIAVTAVLLIYVVPMFKDLFQGAGADLPALTAVVVSASESMQANWYIYLGILIAIVVGFVQANKRSEKFREAKDRFLLKFPIFGPLVQKAAVARYARTLATTFAAGVPLVDALDSAAGASGNTVYKKAIMKIKDDVTSGLQINMAMTSTGVFPNMVNQMVAIGEESGAVDTMLSKVADIYEAEVDDAVDGLSSLIEPFVIVFIGGLVGTIIVAMYLPIFKLGDAF
ncbi:type II secretion system F family protein [Kangiella shandongensis]|uniref:type II secretion system F family protein n=1 Tax=Kangiella shandongensis TaxID=2763258 RepID=UPI001CBC756D|nr:type II secretion system F family protein [Kangiella shandongensis]